MALGHVVTRGYGTGTLAGDVNLVVVRGFTAGAAVATIALSGTVTSATETDIVAGGQTIVLTVANDTWVATVGDNNGITTALINGIDSDGVEATGWDAVVKAGLAFGDVARTSDTIVTITLPAFASYDITANETITVTVPATALTGATETVATPTFAVSYIPVASATTSGGNYGSRYYPAPPKKKKKKTKPKLKLVQTESVEKTQQISEILKEIAENDESPQEKIASLEKVLAEQKETQTGVSPEVIGALSVIAKAQAQQLEILEDLRNQIFLENNYIRSETAEGVEQVLARIEQMQADGDRAKLLQELSRMEAQSETDQDRLKALLVALASV
jgi:hypothetical protein